MMASVSILMSSYWRDSPEQLSQALESLATQTVPPGEVVIVIGGDVPEALEKVFRDFEYKVGLRVLRQEKNEGLGSALQLGLENCRNELVARMDGDDICFLDRIEQQVSFMQENPEVGILSSWHAEFETDTMQVNAIKQTPTSNGGICKGLPWRNIISHPTVMMRRSAVLGIGGYRTMPYSEDYDLWLRVRAAGLPMASIPHPLLYMRVDRQQRVRRGGLHYATTSVAWRWRLLHEGVLNFWQFLATAPLYFIFHIIPPDVRGWFYRFVRRSPDMI